MFKKYPRIVFMGTPEFAVASLKKLIEQNYNVVGVITAPDKPAGRGRKLKEPEVKMFATSHNLQVLQPEKLKSPAFNEQLRSMRPDIQIVVAFRMLPEMVWKLPPLGTINLHASLLPQYRGAAPINHAIMNGETKTGATTFFIRKEIDTGNILLQEEIEILPGDSAGDVHDKLMETGGNLILRTIEGIINKSVVPKKQEELIDPTEELKPAPKIYKGDCKINWDGSTETIYNKIRGLNPYPTAYTELTDHQGTSTTMKIYWAKPETNPRHNQKPGTIVSDGKKYIKIASNDGYLNLHEIQLSGKRKMKVDEFLRGFHEISHYQCF